MSTDTSSSNTTTRYDHPKDCINWTKEFRLRARASNLWNYINPEGPIPWPTQPLAPNMADYPRKLIRIETRASGPSSRNVTPAASYEEVDPDHVPTSISEMTTEGKANYQHDWSTYVFLSKEYKEHRTNLEKLITWIISTTSKTIWITCCKEEETMDKWYLALKATGAAYERNRVPDARAKYQQAIKPLSKLPRNFDQWLTEWETAVAEGQELQLPDTQRATFWARDLAKALLNAMPFWANNFISINEEKIESNELDFRDVAATVRRQWATLYQSKSSTINKGAFPTYNATKEEQLPDEAKSEEGEKKDSRRKRNAKRKRAETQGNTGAGMSCRACLGAHQLPECFYVFEKLSPDGWKQSLSTKRLVRDRIEKDSSLSEEIKRLRKGKDKAPDDSS
jgi:hypothetical protein